jgi:hypothetical protein
VNIIKSIKKSFELAEHVDKYSEINKKEINETYSKTISIVGGTVFVQVEYRDVPPDKLNESFNLLNGCFAKFYTDFFEMLSANKVSD